MKKLSEQTPICKSCFSDLKDDSFHKLFSNHKMCNKCISQLSPVFKEFKINEIEALAVYEYEDKVKEMLFVFKGCFDIELKDIFITPFRNELKLLYFGFIIVPLPSWHEDDEKRGFNHVEEMFKSLNLPMKKVIVKTQRRKQSEQRFSQRKEIKKYLEVTDKKAIEGKKVLLVDDVCTTGSSLKACIELMKECKAKKIKVLVATKRDFSKEEIKQINGAFEVLK